MTASACCGCHGDSHLGDGGGRQGGEDEVLDDVRRRVGDEDGAVLVRVLQRLEQLDEATGGQHLRLGHGARQRDVKGEQGAQGVADVVGVQQTLKQGRVGGR